MTKALLPLIGLLTILFVSCQKEIDIDLDNPPPVPEEIKDSTELIKSISLKMFDPSTGLVEDSVKENYFYDTVNRKIIITSDTELYPFTGLEHSYNNDGLLTSVIYKFPDGITLDDDFVVSVNLDYDADKTIQKLTTRDVKGDIRTILFNKTPLSSDKFELKWDEPLFGGFGEDTMNVRAIFDKEGKCLRWQSSYSYQRVPGGGPDTYTQRIGTDSLIYDELGNVIKILATRVDTGFHMEESFVGCEFLSRHTKGDQLYKLRQVLMKGIVNIPLGEDVARGSISGLLSYFPGGYEPHQYCRYPFQTAKIYNEPTSQEITFTSTTEFDSKDRLVKLRGFFLDYEPYPVVYEISYYK